MGMQKYYAGHDRKQPDGATVWHATPYGTLARIDDCRLVNMQGDMTRTVYITGEPDTWFSIPAMCRIADCMINGYVTGDDDGNLVFRHCYY